MTQAKTLESFDLGSGQIILVDKPAGWSSFQAVKLVNRITKAKVGHAGTLDPLATGLLVFCTGKLTKQITTLIEEDKEYEATFCIGATTPSFDREHPIDQTFDISKITEADIRKAIEGFVGEIQQVPPIYSAIKMQGEAAYDIARRGDEVKMQPRTVTINEFEVTKIEMPLVYCRIACSKGTYIRSLARDLGQALGVGAYLYNLRRTRSGQFHVDDAWNIDDLAKYLIQNKPLILQYARVNKRK